MNRNKNSYFAISNISNIYIIRYTALGITTFAIKTTKPGKLIFFIVFSNVFDSD